MTSYFTGDPMDQETQVGAIICKMQYDKILHYIDIARKEGATILCGGEPVKPEDPKLKVNLVDQYLYFRMVVLTMIVSKLNTFYRLKKILLLVALTLFFARSMLVTVTHHMYPAGGFVLSSDSPG